MIRAVWAFGLLVVRYAAAADTKGLTLACGAYPDGLPSLKECCHAPKLFTYELANACEHMCAKETGDVDECRVDCLLTNNKLVRKKEVNLTAVANMYAKFGLADQTWNPIIEKGLEVCKFDPKDAKGLVKAFNSFEHCMFRHFRKNCVEFNEPVTCDPVEEFMEKCLKTEPNCKVWPSWIVKVPELCCNLKFGLFDSANIKTAEESCQGEVSNLGQMQCIATFLLADSKIKVDGKFDFTVAHKMLTDHSKNDAKWTSAIEQTIKMCEKQVNEDIEAKQTENFINFWFYECVKGSLGDFCADFKTDRKQCRRIKKFKASCPETIPPRRQLMVNGKM